MRVRCVSPHGGAHNGLRADNELPAPEGYEGALKLPPNEGGWVWNAALGFVAVGEEVDAPDDFTCDGFHFVPADAPPADPAPAVSAASAGNLAELLNRGNS